MRVFAPKQGGRQFTSNEKGLLYFSSGAFIWLCSNKCRYTAKLLLLCASLKEHTLNISSEQWQLWIAPRRFNFRSRWPWRDLVGFLPAFVQWNLHDLPCPCLVWCSVQRMGWRHLVWPSGNGGSPETHQWQEDKDQDADKLALQSKHIPLCPFSYANIREKISRFFITVHLNLWTITHTVRTSMYSE